MMENQELQIEKWHQKVPPLLTEVLVGLSKRLKTIPAKFLYDEKGTEIFERICQSKDYYPSMTEKKILQTFQQEISSITGLEGRRVISLSGHDIENLNSSVVIDLLRNSIKTMGTDGDMIVGFDLKKNTERLLRAYDDPEGLMASFNLNLLERLNREVNGTFQKKQFFHSAVYNGELGRVEIHLVSGMDQLVRVNQTVFRFSQGESIHTGSFYKYSVEEFAELCSRAKLRIMKTWKDPENLFCVCYLKKE